MNIVKMKFGSHVYGTNVPTSDTDYKAIYIPSSEDILLQKIKQTITTSTKKDSGVKNGPEDTDTEIFSLDRYLKLLLEGQTVAIDMLFTPSNFFIGNTEPLWYAIKENKDKFLHSGILSFVGYCRTQANKYGIKGSRMSSLKTAIDWLESLDEDSVLWEAGADFIRRITCESGDYCNVVYLKNKNNLEEPYLEVVGRKFGFSLKIKEILKNLNRIYKNYGERARIAMNNEGIDWKALMHAVRVQCEAKELLQTGNITFPRPERNLLLKIRTGSMDYKEVASIIESGLQELETIKSPLPKSPDFEFSDNLIKKTYKERILS